MAIKIARYTGFGFILAGILCLLALTFWWLKTGAWLAISFADAFSFFDVSITVWIQAATSDSDILYFIFADSPLYALLLVTGFIVLLAGHAMKNNQRKLTNELD